MKKKLLATGFVMIGTLLSACAANGAAVVRFAPPPPRYGVVGVAPGPGYMWAGGFWELGGGNYVWGAGRWAPVFGGRRVLGLGAALPTFGRGAAGCPRRTRARSGFPASGSNRAA